MRTRKSESTYTKVKNRMSGIREQTFVRSGRPRRWVTQDRQRVFRPRVPGCMRSRYPHCRPRARLMPCATAAIACADICASLSSAAATEPRVG
jgi:hypothetical protein